MKKNILQLVGSFHSGGSERQAVQLIRLLREDGTHRIFVACLNGEGVLRGGVENLGFREIPEFRLASFYDMNMARQLSRCRRFLRENRIDIIQSHDFYTNVFGMIAGRMANVPVRVAAKRETGTKTDAQRFVERRAYAFAHAVVANAEAVRNHLIETGVAAKKIKVVYNGLDLAKFDLPQNERRAEILQSFGLPSADENLKFVTIVANFRSDVKNHSMFLRAARRVKESFPAARFVLAGEGERLAEIKNLAKDLGLENESFFINSCGDVPRLLFASDICVLSSRTEGFSNSILEYMAAAKPVVATNVGGAGEAVRDGENGFLVASDDDAAMANHLLELLKNEEKAKAFGARGREMARQKFSTAAQLKKTLDLYDRLLRSELRK
ncbi:MAG: glycosyltransferase [Acidobacteriota bacterium]|nr:glycosyltransferase [Acidobacteriota bacterium]